LNIDNNGSIFLLIYQLVAITILFYKILFETVALRFKRYKFEELCFKNNINEN